MQLLLAIVTITLALVFYTLGVFAERRAGELKLNHLGLFALGLIFDTTGTTIMSAIAKAEPVTGITLHQITGMLAIFLMAFHLIWGIYVYFKGSIQSKQTFHRFSLVVWLFWLVPYIVGMIVGMKH
ncbi:HsmA family protein [Enterococcus sp. AZ109]|uniref:HsmA family protein n=1 Tax=Enterococcus sp. AZ109 TaxID=2774634 RepID=UPI003F20BBE5